ncbi:sugar transferase [Paenibacillus sp. 22594]|uniref:sugar transferase n=1 Tax=Paenibacillus sp. 22594 TaxID=3453947 RepID=UPI003F83679A
MRPYLIIKQLIDIFISSIALLILFPFFLLISIIIKCTSKGPVLFKQRRIGKGKKEFYILKFRTMYIEAPNDMPTHLLENPDLHITKIGRLLRKTSLDEMPQILNIIKGDMSIVGPRPALWNQNDLIRERDKHLVNCIKPGLTGWAQVNGRDELSIDLKVKLDGEYVEKIGFLFDLKIFLKTFQKVFKSEGVIEGKNETGISVEHTL